MKKEFAQGVVFAAARLIEMHDQPDMALEIVREAGLTRADLKQCSEYDLKTLRREDKTIPRGIH